MTRAGVEPAEIDDVWIGHARQAGTGPNPARQVGRRAGHPIGCTGARILVTLIHEMQRRGARLGLATLCVSGGMGMAVAVERM
ncbi:MAG: hypothetical protein HYX76_14275 [Acidobacteria bacterium]|nr:hypothetical protein [Acidobacteriota bacterium]